MSKVFDGHILLSGFPEMDKQTEEGLCELVAYLYLLSLLREPDESALIRCNEADLRYEIFKIESTMHTKNGKGFRVCVESLRGRKLHELLGFVRQHGTLPPPLPPGTSGLGFEGLT